MGGGGGGILNYGILTMSNSAFSGNSAGAGGGIFNTDNAGCSVTLNNVAFSGNSGGSGGGGGIYNTGSLTVSNSTIAGNSGQLGGGIYNNFSLTVTSSTISGNTAGGQGGGGFYNAGTLTMSDSTIAGNYAGDGSYGGGIDNFGPLTASNSTISGNYSSGGGGGIYNGASVALQNTILAGNTAVSGPDVYNYVSFSASYSLIGNTSDSGITGGTGNVLNPTYLGLSTLGNYGGPTQTIALLPGSPASGAGETIAGITTDQRGFSLDSPDPDIGAFPGGGIFGYGYGGYALGMLDDGQLFLTDVGISGVSSNATVTDTNWHQIAVTVNDGTVIFYVDGVASAPISRRTGQRRRGHVHREHRHRRSRGESHQHDSHDQRRPGQCHADSQLGGWFLYGQLFDQRRGCVRFLQFDQFPGHAHHDRAQCKHHLHRFAAGLSQRGRYGLWGRRADV